MKKIDETDTPKGYDLGGRASCNGFIFNEDLELCGIYNLRCSKIYQADEQDVIFKRKDEMSESLNTALGNLPLALERFQHYKKEAFDLHHN